MLARTAGLLVLLVVAFFGLKAGSAGQDKDSGHKEASEAITAVLTAQQAAWNRGDIATFLDGYWKSPELTFSGPNGIVRGYDGVLERYQKSYPDIQTMGELQFSGLEIRMLGSDTALVLGHWQLTRKVGDVGGVFTLVLKRMPEGWRIIHDHTSRQKLTP